VTRGLHRFQQSRQTHFLTFSCYRRQAHFNVPPPCDLFIRCLEDTRRHIGWRVYGYVVMPEHIHLLVSEPEFGALADAMRELKLRFSKRWHGQRAFWQKRYYDRNVRDQREFRIKLRYLHRNPVTRGLVKEAGDGRWSSFRQYAQRETVIVEIESAWTARDREITNSGGSARKFLSPGELARALAAPGAPALKRRLPHARLPPHLSHRENVCPRILAKQQCSASMSVVYAQCAPWVCCRW